MGQFLQGKWAETRSKKFITQDNKYIFKCHLLLLSMCALKNGLKILLAVVLVSLFVTFTFGFRYALDTSPASHHLNANVNVSCATFKVVKPCFHCSNYEKKVEPACRVTGNALLIACNPNQIQQLVSCPYSPAYETNKFWIFECSMFAASLIFNGIVWLRRGSMDKFMYQRLKRQISTGV